jgi:hypothetical protein
MKSNNCFRMVKNYRYKFKVGTNSSVNDQSMGNYCIGP